MSLGKSCFLILSVLILASSGFSTSASAAWPKKHVRKNLTLLKAEDLMRLPVETRALYIQQIRVFLVDMESRERRKFAKFAASSEFLDFLSFVDFDDALAADTPATRQIFPDDNGVCNKFDPNTQYRSTGVGTIIASHNDKCIIGGHIVCMVVTDAKGLSCYQKDLTETMKKLQGDCGQGKIECMKPFFLKADSSDKTPHCESWGVGLTKKCDSGSISADDLAKKLSDPKLQADYKRAAKDLSSYCGTYDPKASQLKFSNANYFDQEDCQTLQTKLDLIAPPVLDKGQTPHTSRSDQSRHQQVTTGSSSSTVTSTTNASATTTAVKEVRKIVPPQAYQGKVYNCSVSGNLGGLVQNNPGTMQFKGTEVANSADPKKYDIDINIGDTSSSSNWRTGDLRHLTRVSNGKVQIRGSSDLTPDSAMIKRALDPAGNLIDAYEQIGFWPLEVNQNGKMIVDDSDAKNCLLSYERVYRGQWDGSKCTIKIPGSQDQVVFDGKMKSTKAGDPLFRSCVNDSDPKCPFIDTSEFSNLPDKLKFATPANYVMGTYSDKECRMNFAWDIQGKVVSSTGEVKEDGGGKGQQ